MKTTLYFIELCKDDNFIRYECFIRLLSSERQLQIHKFRYDIDKKLSLFSDLFVRYLVCKAFDLNNANLRFGKNDFGKPYLVGFPDFHYNISHTRNAIAIGVSEIPIGVDIEKNKLADLEIATRFFCKRELNYIISGNEEQERLFYHIWTKKEAYIKWLGRGLSIPLTTFDVTDAEIEWLLNTIEINDYLISVCSIARFDKMEFFRLNENQASEILAEYFKIDYDTV